MTEATSVTTFVIGAELPWPDDSAPLGDSGDFERGVLHDAAFRQDCAIRKISSLGATIRSRVQRAPGEEVVIELPSGQRTAAKVHWVKAGESGIEFSKPVDVLALVNRHLVSQPVDRRAMPRVEIRCGAFVKRGEDFVPVTVRNISARGLQVEGDSLPAAGSYVAIFVEGLAIPPGEISWRRGTLAGIELMEELSWSSIMPWVRETGRRGADGAVA
jgi:hypothetical protein